MRGLKWNTSVLVIRHESDEMFANDWSLAESVTKTLLMEKIEGNEESEVQEDKEKVAAESKASDPEQKEDAKEEAEQTVTSVQSDAPEQPAAAVEEPETQSEPSEEK